MNILFIGGSLTFEKRDYEILKEKYDVIMFKYYSYFDVIRRLPKLIKGILKSDLIYIWFGSVLSAFIIFLAKISKKRTIIIAGGYDTANEKEIGYGAMGHPIKKHFQIYSFNNASLVLPVSNLTKQELLKYTKPKSYRLVYNGVPSNIFYPSSNPKKNQVITVVTELNELTVKNKGIITFIKTAALMPSTKFFIIGKLTKKIDSHLKPISTSNVSFTGYLKLEELLELYQQSKVYAQLSKRESFGMAMAEAMLCECVPVATSNGALPEVIGDTGFYIKYNDINSIKQGIEKALKSKLGPKARRRILNLYPLSKRKKHLYEIIGEK
jgi:glycosyltransferase involved in cell wall biosynthesis